MERDWPCCHKSEALSWEALRVTEAVGLSFDPYWVLIMMKMAFDMKDNSDLKKKRKQISSETVLSSLFVFQELAV